MLMDLPPTAVIDATGQYRYSLTRTWASMGPWVAFIMLNPSTADDFTNDPTVRRCIRFAKSWSFGGLEIVNLFAYRATDPRDLRNASDPIGPENDRYIKIAATRAAQIIVAWGRAGLNRDAHVAEILRGMPVFCLGLTKDGQPKHPLYLHADTERQLWRVNGR